MRKTIVFFLLVGCNDGAISLEADGGREVLSVDASPVSMLDWPKTCGSVRGEYVPCCPAGEACEAETCDCAATPPEPGKTVCRRLSPDWVTVCYDK